MTIFNLIEACVWICIGILLFLVGPKYFNWRQKHGLLVGILFFLFGVSDIVEIFSGSWYKPWWLLVWKVLNAFLILFFIMRLIRRHDSSANLRTYH